MSRPPPPSGHVGELLRHWRGARRMSQLDLALEAEISTRHLSCVETGRARPSREMVLLLASALEIPLRERNALLLAAGFAPAYKESELSDADLAQVRHALDFILERSAPYGCVVLDRQWNVRRTNAPMERMLAWLLGDAVPAPGAWNLMTATFDPSLLRPYIANFDTLGPELLARLEREHAAEGDPRTAALLKEIRALPDAPASARDLAPALPFVPVRLEKGGLALELFTTLTTLGTPQDITLADLRIETYYPADAATEQVIAALDQLVPA